MQPFRPTVEALEQRIAPASITFLDLDGDQVTVTASKGTKEQLMRAAGLATEGGTFHLYLLDLASNPVFKRTDLTISVAANPDTGDGLVSIGKINADGIDLGRVNVMGDLAQIDAGDANLRTPALKSLQARGLGTDPSAQVEGADLRSSIQGDLPSVVLTGDLAGTLAINGKLGTMEVRNLVGGESLESGSIITAKGITSLKVQNLQGGSTSASGTVKTDGAIGSIQVLGSLLGGSGDRSGSIGSSKSIGTVTVAANVAGGSGLQSGSILAGLDIAKVAISVSLSGGEGKQSGSVLGRDLRSVVVGGAVIGGAGNVDGVGAEESGRIFALRNLFYAEVGSLQGGTANFSGAIGAESNVTKVIVHQDVLGNAGRESGVIGAGKLLSSVTVEGSVLGGSGPQSGAILSAGRIAEAVVQGSLSGSEGEQSGVIATAGGITKVTVGSLVGGTGRQSGAIGSTLGLGSVTVLGNIVGSSVLGNGDDAQIASAGTIGSIDVRGSILGGASTRSGSIVSLGAVSRITVDGVLTGGDGESSGSIAGYDASLGTISLGGVLGGAGYLSGGVDANSINKVEIKGDLQGGIGTDSARIAAGKIGSVYVQGSIKGNPGDNLPDGTRAGVIDTMYLGAVTIDGDLVGGSGSDSGVIRAVYNQPSITIGGSIYGGFGNGSGGIFGGFVGGEEAPYYTTIRSIVIKGSIFGGGGVNSGVIDVTGTVSNLVVGDPNSLFLGSGSIVGGNGNQSGAVRATSLGNVTLLGSLQGGTNFETGHIMGFDGIDSVTIGESLIGGSGDFNGSNRGQISSHGRIGAVTVGFAIVGGSEEYGGSIVGGSIGTVRVGFEATSGEGSEGDGGITAGAPLGSGAIVAFLGDIGRIETPGALYGGTQGGQLLIAALGNIGTIKASEISGDAPHAVLITAAGENGKVAIGNVLVSGSMSNADIIAGYDNTQSFGTFNAGDLVNIHTQIGTVDVGAGGTAGEPVWRNNNVVAGAYGAFGDYGDLGETNFEPVHSGSAYSKIAKIIIRGSIDAGDPDYRFGLVAEVMGTVIVDGQTISLTPGPLNDTVLIGTDSRTYINEQILGTPA